MRKSFLFLADGFEEVGFPRSCDVLRRGTIEVKKRFLFPIRKRLQGAHGVPVVADLC